MRCDEDVRRAAAVEALGALEEHAAVDAPAIAALLQDGDVGVRVAAVEALGALGEHAAATPRPSLRCCRTGMWA